MSKKTIIYFITAVLFLLALAAISNFVNQKSQDDVALNRNEPESVFQYSDTDIAFQYPKNFKTSIVTTNLPVNNQECIYISKIEEPNPTEPEQVSVCLYTKKNAQTIPDFIQSQYEQSVLLLNAMVNAKDYSAYEKKTITNGANTFEQFTSKQTTEKTAMRDLGTILVSVSAQGTSEEIVRVYDLVLNTWQTKSASTWLTYTDERDGFSLLYPATWKIAHGKAETGNDRGIWLYSEASPSLRYQLSISVESNPKNLSAEQWVQELKPAVDSRPRVIGKVQIGPYDGYAITNVFAGDSNLDSWYLAQGGNTFRFDFPVAEANENLANPIENNATVRKILSTFQLP